MKDCYCDNLEGSTPDSNDAKYNSFMVNRGLSYFQDTVLFANAMNERSHLPVKMQYDFLRHGIRPRKRFSAWFKKKDDSEVVQMIMDKYDYSSDKALNVLELFSEEDIENLKKEMSIGGLGKKSKK